MFLCFIEFQTDFLEFSSFFIGIFGLRFHLRFASLRLAEAHCERIRQLFDTLGDARTGVITFKMLEETRFRTVFFFFLKKKHNGVSCF